MSKHVAWLSLVIVLGCGSKKDPEQAPAPAPVVKEPAPTPTPAPEPARPTPADDRMKIEATKDGIADLSIATPLTMAQVKKLVGADVLGPFEELRGGKRTWSLSFSVGDFTSANITYTDKAKAFAWVETTGHGPELTTCVDGVCLGDPLAAAKALAGATCKANHDGQGYSASFQCGRAGAALVILASLPDDVRQEHALGQRRDAFPIDELIAAKGTIANFAWVVQGATWEPSSYNEGDR